MIFWAVAGSIAIRHAYLRRDLDTSNAPFVGAMLGAASGPFGLAPTARVTSGGTSGPIPP